MNVDISAFGMLPDGQIVQVVTLRATGTCARVLTLGAALQDFRLPGVPHSLTLGSNDVAAYLGPMRYAGAIVGPVANRIGGARVTINCKPYALQANDGENTLHGGDTGTHAAIWQIAEAAADFVVLYCDLPSSFDGLPGNRRIMARYELAPMALSLTISAESDAATLMNPAPHPYWNLDGSLDIAGHHLRVDAETYLPTDAACLPTGAQTPVQGTRFELRAGHVLTREGFDHNFCLSDAPTPQRPVAWLTGRSGLRMTLETTAPGLQVYDGSGITSGGFNGHNGAPYHNFAGIALEPQFWPDAPNHTNFPSILLPPSTEFRQKTRFSFARR
jgi:aldose 1-epimerase